MGQCSRRRLHTYEYMDSVGYFFFKEIERTQLEKGWGWEVDVEGADGRVGVFSNTLYACMKSSKE